MHIYMYVCVCIYVYVCVCIYIYICTHIYIYRYIHIYVHIYIHALLYIPGSRTRAHHDHARSADLAQCRRCPRLTATGRACPSGTRRVRWPQGECPCSPGLRTRARHDSTGRRVDLVAPCWRNTTTGRACPSGTGT